MNVGTFVDRPAFQTEKEVDEVVRIFLFGVFEGGATGGRFQAHVVADCETFRCSV